MARITAHIEALLHPEYDVMIDQIYWAGTRRIDPVFGHLDEADMLAVNRARVLFLGVAS